MDSYAAQFFIPLLIGLAVGLLIGFYLGARHWRRLVMWANEITHPPMDVSKKQKY